MNFSTNDRNQVLAVIALKLCICIYILAIRMLISYGVIL